MFASNMVTSAARSSWKVNLHNDSTKTETGRHTLRCIFSFCIDAQALIPVSEKGLTTTTAKIPNIAQIWPLHSQLPSKRPHSIRHQATRHRRKPKPAHNCTLHTLMQAKRENRTLTVIHLVRGTSPTKGRTEFNSGHPTEQSPVLVRNAR